jgi:hypothetical protein
MGNRAIVRTLTLGLVGIWFTNCVDTRLEIRKHPLQVETQPAGAQVWVQDETGKRLVGQSPVQLEQQYQAETQSFNRWLWAAVAASAVGTGIGGFTIYNGWVNQQYGFGQFAGGISLATVCVAGLVVSLVYSVLGEQADGNTMPLPQQIVIGADFPDQESLSQELEIPTQSGPITLSQPTVETPQRPASQDGPVRAIVAVFDIQDDTGKFEPPVVARLSNYLGTILVQHGAFRVVPRDQLRVRLLQEKLGTYKACYDESCQIELGKAVAAQKSLATTLMPLGDTCTLTANLVDLKTETAERGASAAAACTEADLATALMQIAQQLSR